MAINPNAVGVPAQSKSLDTATTTTTAGLVHRQVISLADPETSTNYARVSGDALYVSVQNASIAVSGTFWQATQPVSFTRLSSGTDSVTADIGTTNGLALDITVDSLLKPSSTLSAVSTITNTVTVKADTLVNQTNAFKVDGSAVTQPVSAVSLPLPTGAATESTLSSLSAKFSPLGQATMSASVPVVLASNHSDIITKKASSSYNHIDTTGTTTVKSGSGILRRIVINTKGSSSNTLTVYDNTSGSGTIIAVIDTVNGVSGHFEYNAAFSTGLTIVNASGTSADFTVIYE